MSIINNGLLLASGADAATTYQISRSLRFNSADSAYLSRTPGSAGNRKTFTFSCWLKRSGFNSSYELTLFSVSQDQTGTTPRATIRFTTGDALEVGFNPTGSAWSFITTSSVYRDTSAWYHLVVAVDTTQSTASNRTKIYINGTQVTNFSSANYLSQNTDTPFNYTYDHSVGRYQGDTAQSGYYFNGYLADIYFLDGTATDPSTFAETDAVTGQWVPKTPTGISYGTNGFRLTFSDNSGTTSTTLGKDAAGSNNWTPNNFSVASGSGNDSLVDTPTSYGTDTGAGGEVRGNYCTWNPLAIGSIISLANGNLDFSSNSSASFGSVIGTIGVTSGKWYWEVTMNADRSAVGIAKNNVALSTNVAADANAWMYQWSGNKSNNNSETSYGATYTTGDVIGVAFDADNGTLTFYKNGSTQGQAFSGLTSGPYFPIGSDQSSGGTGAGSANFGQRAWAYTPPANYKALCDTNLTAPVVAKPSTVMDVKLYTGNGSTQTVSGLNFSPDWIWFKQRNTTRENHLYDSVRGVQKALYTDLTNAEATDTDALSSFNSDGWTMGADGGSNQNGGTYVAWCWDAGSSAASTNNSGSIQSTVKVNTSAGFSIVTWSSTTGVPHTFGHGLGVAPKFVIVKRRSSTGSWAIGHTSLGWTTKLAFDTSAKAADDSAYWSNTAPTSTVISIGDASNIGGDNIAYCWAPVSGYSSFGSYVGNGSSDGPAIWLGFRPRWILLKNTVYSGASWIVLDTARETYNVTKLRLMPNTSQAEIDSSQILDITANGFKIRDTDTYWNGSGHSIIYCAFAEAPFQYARAR